MKTRTWIIAVFSVIFCMFASGYCMANVAAPESGNASVSRVTEASPARSVSEAREADETVKNTVELKNDVETSSVKFEVFMADNKKVENITIPQGQELVIDHPIYADYINIQGGGTIKLVDFGSINATESLNMSLGGSVFMDNFQPSDMASSYQAGSYVQTYISSDTYNVQAIGSTQIMPSDPYAPASSAFPIPFTPTSFNFGQTSSDLTEVASQSTLTSRSDPIISYGSFSINTPNNPVQILEPGSTSISTRPVIGASIESSLGALPYLDLGNSVNSAAMTSKVEFLKKPIVSNHPKGATRMGPDVGHQIIIADSPANSDDKPKVLSGPIKPKLYQVAGGSTLRGTFEEDKIEE